MKRVMVSFPFDGKTISLECSLEDGDQFRVATRSLLEEALSLTNPGTASGGQFRAFWARAREAGLEKDQAKALLEQRFGSDRRDDLVGQVGSREFSELIDSLGGGNDSSAVPAEVPGMVTLDQLRSFWGKALARGWERRRVRELLAGRLGCARDSEIVGKVSVQDLEGLLKELAA